MTCFIRADENVEWKEFSSAETGCKVLLPGTPTVKKTSEGTRTFHVFTVQRKAIDSHGYIVQVVEQEKPFPDKAAEKTYLAGTQVGFVRTSKGKLLCSKETSFGEFQGVEFSVEVSEGNFVRSRVYVVRARVYSLQFWGKDKDTLYSKVADKYFESFQLAN